MYTKHVKFNTRLNVYCMLKIFEKWILLKFEIFIKSFKMCFFQIFVMTRYCIFQMFFISIIILTIKRFWTSVFCMNGDDILYFILL